jgi:chromosomal replication initiation ATPase DnaA
MRPRTLEEFIGQEQIVGEGRMLRRALERDAVPSLILWGPPGSGKTTLAGIIARATNAHVEPLSAVSSGVADLRRAVQDARIRRRDTGRRTILFIDEIHRFNKAQQDAICRTSRTAPSPDRCGDREPLVRGDLPAALTQSRRCAARLRGGLRRCSGGRWPTQRGLGGLRLTIDETPQALAAGSGGTPARSTRWR